MMPLYNEICSSPKTSVTVLAQQILNFSLALSDLSTLLQETPLALPSKQMQDLTTYHPHGYPPEPTTAISNLGY